MGAHHRKRARRRAAQHLPAARRQHRADREKRAPPAGQDPLAARRASGELVRPKHSGDRKRRQRARRHPHRRGARRRGAAAVPAQPENHPDRCHHRALGAGGNRGASLCPAHEFQHHDPGGHGRRGGAGDRRRHRDERAHRAAAERGPAAGRRRVAPRRHSACRDGIPAASGRVERVDRGHLPAAGVPLRRDWCIFPGLVADHGCGAGDLLFRLLAGRAAAGRQAARRPRHRP
ncbi:hypothetical protein GALL_540390 [mine drainage metagenome]|uniref:Uncharacterized protein n=1 Tax=mine drainage metagenome TaxID=410659 RepID=A0A1J5P045_9ZZZZ